MMLFACSPDPGTAEYVLSKLEQGRPVGGENLDLLGPEHILALRAILDNGNTPRMARMQALERLCQLSAELDLGYLSGYLDDGDPDVRVRIIQWLVEGRHPDAAALLLGRFEREEEDLIRAVLMRSLQTLGSALADPPDALLDRLTAGLAAAQGPRRVDWIRTLGGWHGQRVEALLLAALEDPDPMTAVAAARSLQGPAVRSIERMGPIYVSLLAHRRPEIRRAGLAALEAGAHPNRVSGAAECAEKPVLRLVEAVPEIGQAVDALLAERGLPEQDRKLAQALRECLDRFAPKPAGAGS
jgi:hypothetical protein